jgi:hypothetical protein
MDRNCWKAIDLFMTNQSVVSGIQDNTPDIRDEQEQVEFYDWMEKMTYSNDDEKMWCIRTVYQHKQAAQINGVIMDGFTASAIIKVYDAVNDQNKEKLKKLSLGRMSDVCFKVMK